jgi:hypothetical protein
VAHHSRPDNIRPLRAIHILSLLPLGLQRFVTVKGLTKLPIYSAGVSSGASFAVKLPKAFFSREHNQTCLQKWLAAEHQHQQQRTTVTKLQTARQQRLKRS